MLRRWQILNGTSVAAIQGETCQQMYGFLADKQDINLSMKTFFYCNFKVPLLSYFIGSSFCFGGLLQ